MIFTISKTTMANIFIHIIFYHKNIEISPSLQLQCSYYHLIKENQMHKISTRTNWQMNNLNLVFNKYHTAIYCRQSPCTSSMIRHYCKVLITFILIQSGVTCQILMLAISRCSFQVWQIFHVTAIPFFSKRSSFHKVLITALSSISWPQN